MQIKILTFAILIMLKHVLEIETDNMALNAER